MSAVTSSTRVVNAPAAVKPVESSSKESFSTKVRNAFNSALPTITDVINIAAALPSMHYCPGTTFLGIFATTSFLACVDGKSFSPLSRQRDSDEGEVKRRFIRETMFSASGVAAANYMGCFRWGHPGFSIAEPTFAFLMGARAAASVYLIAERCLLGSAQKPKSTEENKIFLPRNS